MASYGAINALVACPATGQEKKLPVRFLAKRKTAFNSLKVMCVIFGGILKKKKKSSLFPKIARRRRVT